MSRSIQKITLCASRDIPFNQLVLSQSNVRQIVESATAGQTPVIDPECIQTDSSDRPASTSALAAE